MIKPRKFFTLIVGLALCLALVVGAFGSAQAATTLNARVQLNVTANHTKTSGLVTGKDRLEKVFEQLFTSGTGSGMADTLFHDERTLTDGSSEDLDIVGTLTDLFKDTVNLIKVKALIIKNTSTTQTLSVGGASATQFLSWVGSATDLVKIPPGGVMALYNPAGYTAAGGTADKLKILNSAGAACIYDIIIIGSSS